MKQVRAAGLNTPKAPLWVQSFELTNLVQLRDTYGYRANEVFLTSASGAPYDLVSKGDPRTYADLLTASSLQRLRGPSTASARTRARSSRAGPTAPSAARPAWSPPPTPRA